MAAIHFKTVLDGADDHAKLQDLCKLTYKEQAVWLLNAIWEVDVKGQKGGELAESIWAYVDKASVIDNAKATGNALDEMEAHRFLEAFDEAHTVLQMRSSLRKTGALGQSERPKEVPLTHFFLDKYEVDWHKLVNAPQGDNSAKIAEAQDKLQAVQDAFDAASAALKEAQSQEAHAKKAEAEAHASAEEAAKKEVSAKESAAQLAVREEELKKSQVELAAAVEEVKKLEDAYNKKTADLTKKSEEGGVVSRNKAKNELAQHLAEDPLPLRQAKITAEAALRQAEKAAKAAAEARVTAEADAVKASEASKAAQADAKAASAARTQAEAARADAEVKMAEAHQAVAEAEALLAELMKNPGSGHGALWWIERELHEKKKYMPVSKGGVR